MRICLSGIVCGVVVGTAIGVVAGGQIERWMRRRNDPSRWVEIPWGE